MRLRAAGPSDADALADVVAEGFETYRAFAPDGWRPPDRSELGLGISIMLRDPARRAWVAEDAGDIAGQVAYLPAPRSRRPVDDPALAHLGQLFVRRPHWGTGLAARLLDLAVGEAAAEGYAAMRLFTPSAHARARRFYEREGFAAVGDPRFEEPLGLELVEYRRELAPGRPPASGARPQGARR